MEHKIMTSETCKFKQIDSDSHHTHPSCPVCEKNIATNDYLLTCVAEECSEICKEATKGIRFGLHDQWEEKPTAHDALIAEYYDLVAVMEMLFENKILCKPSEEEIVSMIEHKKHRVRHFMKYSAERGHFKGDIV